MWWRRYRISRILLGERAESCGLESGVDGPDWCPLIEPESGSPQHVASERLLLR